METRQDEGRSLGATGLSNQSAWGVIEALECVGRASTNGLGTVGGQCGYTLHNIRDVLRDVQCRISNLTAVANYWGSLCGWYSKTNILRILIT
jgi:hypothetical protein